MSDKSSHDESAKVQTTTVRASKGGASKWLLGGLAAVVLAGGGYLAWKNYTPSQPETQTAYNDPYAPDARHAGPLPSGAQTGAPQSAISEAPAGADSATNATTRTATTHRAAIRRTVPEETIGITPVNATTDENVMVYGQRRPIWTRMPTARRLSALYPVGAQEQGREGEARLHCTVRDNGALNCARVSETRGFGNAALRVANTLRHAPQFADGSDALGAPLNLRVVFRMPPEDRRG